MTDQIVAIIGIAVLVGLGIAFVVFLLVLRPKLGGLPTVPPDRPNIATISVEDAVSPPKKNCQKVCRDMAMKTKYKIGDEVWYRFVGDNIKTTIRRIKIDYKGVPTYYCDFYSSVIAFREEELFPTEEELIKSL